MPRKKSHVTIETDAEGRVIDTDNAEDQRPSKSAAKRADKVWLEIVKVLVQIPEKHLLKLDLDPYFFEQLLLAAKITAHGSKTRQMKYAAQHLRELDVEAESFKEQLRPKLKDWGFKLP